MNEISQKISKYIESALNYKLRKADLRGVWYHLYHENRNNDPAQYNKNYAHFTEVVTNLSRELPIKLGDKRCLVSA